MQQRPLGDSGLAVTPLVLGGNVFGWTADEPTSFAVLDAFMAQGGNAIDTADGYSYWVPGHQGGESETVIGRWLKKRRRRDDVIIGTKVGWWEKRKGLSRANIVEGCEESLARLGIETIDLFWLHRDDEQTRPEEFLGALDSLVKAGKVRLIGVTTPERSKALPDVPTMAEAGYPGTELEIWQGIVAPAGTPPEIVRKLNEEFVKAANAPEVVQKVAAQAVDITTSTPEEFAKLIASDVDRLGKVIRDAGIKAQ